MNAVPRSPTELQQADFSADVSADVATVLADPRRLVILDGVHNFRDLGGYPSAAGTTRWGLVYRADGLQRLTSDDVSALRDRGLGMVIDLRTDTELAERGRFPIDQHHVAFHHLPVIDRTWMPGEVPEFERPDDFLMWAYRDMLKVGADKLASALELIAAAEAPLVFHCAAGKDRTGLLAALLLSVLGVPNEFIAADYGKTAEAMSRMRAAWAAWAAEHETGQALQKAVRDGRSHYTESPAAVMAELLDELAATHGSVTEFVRSLGVSDHSMTALRNRLIEPY